MNYFELLQVLSGAIGKSAASSSSASILAVAYECGDTRDDDVVMMSDNVC